MTINFANPKKQFLAHREEILEAITKVADQGNYVLGDSVEKFEESFATYIGSKYCASVASGTDALVLSLIALDIGIGDEVIVPSLTATATISAIQWVGATPVFVDVVENQYTISPSAVEEMITTKTKAVIAVHLFGNSCDLTEIEIIANKYNIFLIEDCAQATGAEHGGRKLGSIGIIACFSFYPTKNLGALGDGGAVLTSNRILYDRIKSLRQYGWDENRISQSKGKVSRLDEIQAAILQVKLKYLDTDNLKRIAISEKYCKDLLSTNLELPQTHFEGKHVYHLYVVRSPNRNQLRSMLRAEGIETGIHYYPAMHQHPNFTKYVLPTSRPLKVTEKITKEILSIPMYPELLETETDLVISTLCKLATNNL
jgi:dTDP-4-amino-4,6-dideoxygalactose transaminase